MKNIFKGIEEKTPTSIKIIVGLTVIATVSAITQLLISEPKDITAATVMITTMNERGGGSGVIIDTSENESIILTNKHVCEITLKGGLVKTNDGGRYLVTGVSRYTEHDLCLIKVAAKLKSKAVLASSAPKMFDGATISGHPALLPDVLTSGHFNGKKIISIFTGIRKCTDDEEQNELGSQICMFFNGMPSIITSESILVTATIMPGSSGSAVYNENKELSALVFAGQGDLGYAFAIPYEYIVDFLSTPNKEFTSPKYSISMLETSLQGKNLNERCKNIDTKKFTTDIKSRIENLCKVIIRDLEWRNVNAFTSFNK